MAKIRQKNKYSRARKYNLGLAKQVLPLAARGVVKRKSIQKLQNVSENQKSRGVDDFCEGSARGRPSPRSVDLYRLRNLRGVNLEKKFFSESGYKIICMYRRY